MVNAAGAARNRALAISLQHPGAICTYELAVGRPPLDATKPSQVRSIAQ